jgi:hypothetical protein
MHTMVAYVPALTHDQKRKLNVEQTSRLFLSDPDTELGAPVTNSVPIATANDISAGNERFVLDRTLFDVVGSDGISDSPTAPSPPRSSSPVQTQQLSTLDSHEPSFYVAWKRKQREKYGPDWTPVPANPVPLQAVEPYDHLAEFERWLATTDSIEIVD